MCNAKQLFKFKSSRWQNRPSAGSDGRVSGAVLQSFGDKLRRRDWRVAADKVSQAGVVLKNVTFVNKGCDNTEWPKSVVLILNGCHVATLT